MTLSANSLLTDLQKGALILNQVPCTYCRAKQEFPRTHFHGSDWGKCIRDVWFERKTGRKPVQDASDALRLNDGHVHEETLIEMIRRSGHVITHRDKIDGEITVVDAVAVPGKGTIKLWTVGHTDGIIDSQAVIECKAVKDWAWKNKFSKNIIPKQYFGQCQFYLHAHQMQKAFLVVKNRHSSDIMVFEIEHNEKYIAERRVRLAAIEYAIQNHLEIAVPKTEPDDECRFCDFYNHCWGL